MSGSSNTERFRKGEGNIIYANFGARAAADVQKPKQVKTAGTTWAARFLNQAATTLFEPGRLQRGKKYARDGKVLHLNLSDGAASALVQGSQNEPFSAALSLYPLARDQRAELLTALATEPGALQALSMGVMTDFVGALLLGSSAEDLRFDCDCPDPTYPCKHAAALIFHLADELEARPRRLLELRGLSEQHVLEQQRQLSAARAEQSKADAKSISSEFWEIRGPLPALPNPKIASALEDTDIQLLQEALRTVSYTNIDMLQAVSDVEDCYYFLTTHDGV